MRFRYMAFLVALLAGCYVYKPVGTGSPPSGRQVRLTLTDAGTANLAAELGPSVEAVGGRLTSDSGAAYLLALSETRKRNGVEIDWRGEEVSMSKSFVATLEQREFSRTRTAVLSAGVVSAIVVAVRAFLGPVNNFGGAPPKPGPTPR